MQYLLSPKILLVFWLLFPLKLFGQIDTIVTCRDIRKPNCYKDTSYYSYKNFGESMDSIFVTTNNNVRLQFIIIKDTFFVPIRYKIERYKSTLTGEPTGEGISNTRDTTLALPYYVANLTEKWSILKGSYHIIDKIDHYLTRSVYGLYSKVTRDKKGNYVCTLYFQSKVIRGGNGKRQVIVFDKNKRFVSSERYATDRQTGKSIIIRSKRINNR